MMEDIILYCLTCNELFCPTRYDISPSYRFDKDFIEEERDDLKDFSLSHKGHKIQELIIEDNGFFSTFAYLEPIREDYIRAKSDSDTLTVKRWRDDINKPLKYEIVKAELVLDEPVFSIQTSNIRDQMIYDSRKYGFNNEIIETIISLYDNFVSHICIDDIQECGFSMLYPMVSYAVLTDNSKKRFLDYCQFILGLNKIKMLGKFIADNSEYDGVMNIQITHPFHLEPIGNFIYANR